MHRDKSFWERADQIAFILAALGTAYLLPRIAIVLLWGV